MTSSHKEPTTVGLTDGSHATLQGLKEQGVFPDMLAGFRFALALALAHGAIAEEGKGSRQTVFNVGTFDPDRSILRVVSALRPPDLDEPVYVTCQRLAEWGLEELERRLEDGELDISAILQEAEGLVD